VFNCLVLVEVIKDKQRAAVFGIADKLLRTGWVPPSYLVRGLRSVAVFVTAWYKSWIKYSRESPSTPVTDYDRKLTGRRWFESR
jgi:hypothetical protein